MGQVLELVNVGRFGFINVCRNRRYDAGRTICRLAIKNDSGAISEKRDERFNAFLSRVA